MFDSDHPSPMSPSRRPWVRKIPWRMAWQPTPVFWSGASRGQEPGGLPFMGSQSQTRLSDGAQQLSLRRPQSGGCCGAGVLVWRGVSWGHGRQLSVFPWEVCVDATPRGQRALPREVGGRGLCSLCRDSAFERCARAREAGGARWQCPGYVGLSPPTGTSWWVGLRTCPAEWVGGCRGPPCRVSTPSSMQSHSGWCAGPVPRIASPGCLTFCSSATDP